jgi:hypothetical protein
MLRVHSLFCAVVAAAIAASPALAQNAPAPAAKPPAAKPATAKPPAAKPAAPAPAAPPGAALELKGFRSATFGMTPAQVKAAAAADFGASAKIQEGSNPADGTQFVLVQVDHLDPAPGPAQVGYVFGATAKTLTNINVVWSTGPAPTDAERAAIALAGQQLVAYFKSGPAPAKISPGIAALGDNALVLYAAADKKNAGVQVMLDGVAFQRTTGDKAVASPPPKGPASLRIAYAQDIDKADVKTLKPGSF